MPRRLKQEPITAPLGVQPERDGVLQCLECGVRYRGIAQHVRQKHGIDTTLREQLAQAVANEQYEVAAKLRDALRRRE